MTSSKYACTQTGLTIKSRNLSCGLIICSTSIFCGFLSSVLPLCVSSAKLKQFEALHLQARSPEVSLPPSLLTEFGLHSYCIHLCQVFTLQSVTVARGVGFHWLAQANQRPPLGDEGPVGPTCRARLLHNGRGVGCAPGSSRRYLLPVKQPPRRDSRCQSSFPCVMVAIESETYCFVHRQKPRTQGHHLPKILYLLPFTRSQEQITITTNKNLQGDQTLDINKDTINIKVSPCCMWLPPFLAVYVLVATAKPGSPGKAEASVMGLWNLHHKAGHQVQSISSLSHHQPDRMSATSK